MSLLRCFFLLCQKCEQRSRQKLGTKLQFSSGTLIQIPEQLVFHECLTDPAVQGHSARATNVIYLLIALRYFWVCLANSSNLSGKHLCWKAHRSFGHNCCSLNNKSLQVFGLIFPSSIFLSTAARYLWTLWISRFGFIPGLVWHFQISINIRLLWSCNVLTSFFNLL